MSPCGVRSLSKNHAVHLYVLEHAGQRFEIGYVPGESDSRLFGGNSNWRGPVWMPMNMLLKEDAVLFHEYFDGDTGCGLGASHQTGWTALIALLMDHAEPTGPAP